MSISRPAQAERDLNIPSAGRGAGARIITASASRRRGRYRAQRCLWKGGVTSGDENGDLAEAFGMRCEVLGPFNRRWNRNLALLLRSQLRNFER